MDEDIFLYLKEIKKRKDTKEGGIEKMMGIKKPRAIEVPTKEEIYKEGLLMYQNASWYPMELLGIYFQMYLFGQRIKEALMTKVKDFMIKKIRDKKRKDVLLVILTSVNLKTRKVYLKKKTLPLVIDEKHKIEGAMFEYLYKFFLKPKIKEGKLDDFVFSNLVKYKQQNINNRFKKYAVPFVLDVVMPNGEFVRGFYYILHPHFLRHCRLTHLVEEGLDIIDLMKFAGWTTPMPALVYARPSVDRIIEKLLGKRIR